MPHLRFEVTEPLAATELQSFAAWVTDRYAEIMDTGTGHVGVTVRDDAHLTLGRAVPDDPVALLNADIRAGRTLEKRREFAVAVLEEMADRWGVPTGNAYVVYTEHPGEDIHLREGALDSWADGSPSPPGTSGPRRPTPRRRS